MVYRDDFSLKLLPAEPADIPALARLHVAAGGVDVATRIMFPNDREFEKAIVDMLRGQVSCPGWLVMKAIDLRTGQLMGWAAWQQVHYYPQIDATTQQEIEANVEEIGLQDADGAGSALEKAKLDLTPGLQAYLRSHSHGARSSWMGERKFMFLNSLMTEPRYQRKGVGTALVEWGNAMADADIVPSFLRGSPFAYKVYLRCGWKVVEKFDVDLREWAPGGKRDDMGYGNYSYYYMIRLPETRR